MANVRGLERKTMESSALSSINKNLKLFEAVVIIFLSMLAELPISRVK
jgi:hypothetical protein